MKEEKKMNTYVRYSLIMLGSTIAGGILGFALNFIDLSGISGGVSGFMDMARRNMTLIMAFFSVVLVLCGELTLKKIQSLGRELSDAEDEEADVLEYKMEKAGAVGTIASQSGIAAGILIIAACYSAEYIGAADTNRMWVLTGFVIFCILCLYQGYWQVRFVKKIQKIEPDKKGDPSSMKFQKQWIESCDEAEREMIYQSSYTAYQAMSTVLPLLLVFTMICHLMWNTGVMAVFAVAVIWIVMVASYCKTCVTKRKQKLSRD